MPFANPLTVHEVSLVVEQLPPSGVAVTVYPVIGAPPSEAGAAQATAALPSPGTAVTRSGAPGTVRGVTSAVGHEGVDEPAALTAVTVNAYARPLTSSFTVQDVAPLVVHVRSPGRAVTVYPLTGDPPSPPLGSQLTSTEALPAATTTPVGVSGTVTGVTESEGADDSEVPRALLAETRKTYAVPLVSPITTQEVPEDTVQDADPGVEATV
ncbi:MAG: hypothetical protein WCF12_07765 [Propionicimonas sp.]